MADQTVNERMRRYRARKAAERQALAELNASDDGSCDCLKVDGIKIHDRLCETTWKPSEGEREIIGALDVLVSGNGDPRLAQARMGEGVRIVAMAMGSGWRAA